MSGNKGINGKRLMTIALVIGISFLVISIPYTENANALIGGVLVGVGIGVGIAMLYNYLTHKHDSNNIEYSMDNEEYINRWDSYFTHFDNIWNTYQNDIQNILSLFNLSSLQWERYAEKKAVEYINYTTWNSTIENMIIADFNNYTRSIWINIYTDYLNCIKEVCHELGSMHDRDFINTSYYDGFYIHAKADAYTWTKNYILAGSQNIGGTWHHFYPDCKFIIGSYNTTVENNITYVSISEVENETNISALLSYTPNFQWFVHMGTDTSKNYEGYLNMGNHLFKIDVTFNSGGTLMVAKTFRITSARDNAYTFTIADTTKYTITFYNLADIYDNIKTKMLSSANAYWNYLHALGYYNVTDIPDDYIPIYPDVVLDDFFNIANVSDYNTSKALYYATMQNLYNSLDDMIENNKTGVLDWKNVSVGNFTGKKFLISVSNANITDGNINTIIDNHTCYVIPYQNDLTLNTNTVYAFTMNETLPSWADELINQQMLGIFDLVTGKWYYLTTDENTYYNITVLECYVGDNSVNSVKLDVSDAGNITYYNWGFGYTPITTPIPIIPNNNSDNIWDKYKGLIGIACIVIGLIMMTDKHYKTLGMLLLLAGIGIIGYYYIYPAISGASDIIDKITFWK